MLLDQEERTNESLGTQTTRQTRQEAQLEACANHAHRAATSTAITAAQTGHSL
jgi:hypothetical protein